MYLRLINVIFAMNQSLFQKSHTGCVYFFLQNLHKGGGGWRGRGKSIPDVISHS